MKLESNPLEAHNAQSPHSEIDYPESIVFAAKTDTKGAITHANDSCVEVCGYSREQLIGSHHNLIRHSEMPKWALADLWKTIQSGHPLKNRCYLWHQLLGMMSHEKQPASNPS